MNNQEILLAELEIKMDAIILKYEIAFKQSKNKLEEFFQENYETFSSEIARLVTDTIHDSIINDISNDQNFIFLIQKLNVASVIKLMQNLKRIYEENSKK